MKTKPLPRIRALVVTAALAAAFPGSLPAAFAASASLSTPSSASELFEQGVYNEDTKGDLDAAISIYQQLATQVQANDSLAAQAEFRLAECYLKKNQKEKAAAAFQKLVKDFPGETRLVAQAKQYLPAALKLEPIPWMDGERLGLTLFGSDGTPLGVMEYRANLLPENLWRVGTRLECGGASAVSSVDADPASFSPVRSHWKYSVLGHVLAVYEPGQVNLTYPEKQNSSQKTVKLDGPVIDNEEAMDVIRRLPLAIGYKANLPIFSTLGGQMVPIDIEVIGKESAQVPAGTFDCYKVSLSVGQTFWFSADAHRYLVQFEAGPMTAKLTSIAQRRPDEPVSFRDDELGVSLTAPPDWMVFRYKLGQPGGQALIRTYDPDGDSVDGGVRMFPTNTLPEEERKSSKAWADGERKASLVGLGPDARVRPDSGRDYTVAGRPGAALVIDCTDAASGKKRTYFSLYVIGAKDSEHFVLICPPDKFDALMKQFSSIIASYQRT